MPGFSFIVTLVAAGATRLTWSTESRWRRVGAVTGIVVLAIGVVADQSTLTAFGLLLSAVAVGSSLGRALPPTPLAAAATLGLLSVADIVWIRFGNPDLDGAIGSLATLMVEIGGSTSSIGTVDVILAAAVTAHWLARGASGVLPLTPAPLGMALANVWVRINGVANLPLIPFIAVGWLVTEGWHRWSHRSGRPRQEAPTAVEN